MYILIALYIHFCLEKRTSCFPHRMALKAQLIYLVFHKMALLAEK